MFLEDILGKEAKIKILRSLFDKPTSYTRKELEEETGLSTGAVHSALKDLQRNEIVAELKGKGKKRFYKANKNGNPIVRSLSELFNQEKFSEREESIPSHHWNRLAGVTKTLRKTLGDELLRVILFGSLARGEATPDSDIDLLIVLKEVPENDIRNVVRPKLRSKWDADFSLLVRSQEQLDEMRKEGTALYEEIQRDGTVIYRKKNSSEEGG